MGQNRTLYISHAILVFGSLSGTENWHLHFILLLYKWSQPRSAQSHREPQECKFDAESPASRRAGGILETLDWMKEADARLGFCMSSLSSAAQRKAPQTRRHWKTPGPTVPLCTADGLDPAFCRTSHGAPSPVVATNGGSPVFPTVPPSHRLLHFIHPGEHVRNHQ